MSTRIEIDQHSVFGRKITDLMSVLVDTKNKSANLKAALDAMAAGGTFTQVEAEVGGMTPGTGEALYNLLTDINQKLASNTLDGVWRLYRG